MFWVIDVQKAVQVCKKRKVLYLMYCLFEYDSLPFLQQVGRGDVSFSVCVKLF